jgi:hypothetical protein
MTFLSSSLSFGLLVVFHVVLNSNFKLCAFVVNGIIKGNMSMFEFESRIFSWFGCNLV